MSWTGRSAAGSVNESGSGGDYISSPSNARRFSNALFGMSSSDTHDRTCGVSTPASGNISAAAFGTTKNAVSLAQVGHALRKLESASSPQSAKIDSE
jgi:hypothetical protein